MMASVRGPGALVPVMLPPAHGEASTQQGDIKWKRARGHQVEKSMEHEMEAATLGDLGNQSYP